jgi:hypothetical protein
VPGPFFKKKKLASATKWVSDISENLDFFVFIPQKRASTGHFGARDDPIIRIRNFF